MHKRISILLISIMVVLSSCDVINQLATEVNNNTNQSNTLSEADVVKGLKRALDIGTANAVQGLSVENAFYESVNYKILLPPEAKIITDNKDNALLQAVGVDKLIKDVEVSMNKAAENAIVKAKPIFIDAITKMSIDDAFGILKGSDTAATNYLRVKTYNQLYNQFKPEVTKVLSQAIYQNISTQQAWSNLTNAYNGVARFVPNWNKVNTKLDDYVTEKALTALFEEVKKEETKIRKDPAARVDELLRQVFGS